MKFIRKLIAWLALSRKEKATVVVKTKKEEVIADAVIEARREIFEQRKANWEERSKQLGDIYSSRLNQLLNEYFLQYSDDKEENDIAFSVLDKTWKGYAQKANATQRRVRLDPQALKVNIEAIVASPAFIENLKKARSYGKENTI